MINANMVKDLREKTGAGMLDCKKALEATNGDMDKAIDWLREKGISNASKKASRIAAEGLAYAYTLDNKAIILEVNSETDFVAKNEEFQEMVKNIAECLLESDVTTVEDALNLNINGGTINDLITEKTSKIGEKLSFRRFEKLEKTSDETFGTYSHMGGKIVTLVKLSGSESVSKDIAMHIAAMRPLYLNKDEVPSEEVEKERAILTEQANNEGLPAEKIPMIVNGRLGKFYEEVCLEDQNYVKENKMKVSVFLKNNDAKVLKFIRYEVGEGMEKREENFAEEVEKQMKK